MPKYTDEDVQRLVEAAECISKIDPGIFGNAGYRSFGVGSCIDERLTAALKPFLPDPEEVLIDKMAREIHDYGSSGYATHPWEGWRDHYQTIARIALAVVKEEGWRHGTD